MERFASARSALFSSSPAEESGECGGTGDDDDPIASPPPSRPRATIIAPATPTAQAAALAVLRVSGPHADAVLRGLMPRGQPLPEPRVATLVRLLRKEGRDSRRADEHNHSHQQQQPPRLLDRALALRFPGPRSYTGEDVVELHVHGGTAVVSAVMEAALEVGSLHGDDDEEEGANFAVRVAEPGEFTRRAFESGKIDLTAAEGIADLIAAADDASAASAAALADGRLREAAKKWRRRAVELLAAAEAAAEFEDDPAAMTLIEEEEEKTTASVASGVSRGASLLADALDDALAAAAASRIGSSASLSTSCSPRVALLGLPNAGKSSLLNALTRTELAIVTGEPGTTRDVLEVAVELRRRGGAGGDEPSPPSSSPPSLTVVVCDTAGVRDSQQSPGKALHQRQQPLSAAEAEGVRRALEAAAAASVVVLVVDGEKLARTCSSSSSSSEDARAEEHELGKLAERALSSSSSSLIVAVNKCDAIQGEEGLEIALAAARRVAATAAAGGRREDADAFAVLPLSAATGEGLGALVDALRSAVAAAYSSPCQKPPPPAFSAPPLPLQTERHRAALAAASAALRRAVALGVGGGGGGEGENLLPSPELVAEELREAVSEIGALSAGGGRGGTTGCDVDGEVLDAVFSRFCVGK